MDGHRFAPHSALLDPYSPLVSVAARGAGARGNPDGGAYRCHVADQEFDWQGAYCQENPISWSDWKLAERNVDLIAFVTELIAFRKQHPALSADRFYSPDEITWLGQAGSPPDWDGPDNVVGCVLREEGAGRICLLFNASRDCRVFHLPDPADSRWRVVVDTSKATASAVRANHESDCGTESELRVEPRSVLAVTCGA